MLDVAIQVGPRRFSKLFIIKAHKEIRFDFVVFVSANDGMGLVGLAAVHIERGSGDRNEHTVLCACFSV